MRFPLVDGLRVKMKEPGPCDGTGQERERRDLTPSETTKGKLIAVDQCIIPAEWQDQWEGRGDYWGGTSRFQAVQGTLK
jgi:hypothetical protein